MTSVREVPTASIPAPAGICPQIGDYTAPACLCEAERSRAPRWPCPSTRPMKGWSSTVQFKVTAEDLMVAATNCTTSNDEIQAARGIRPLFDDESEGHA